jgi:hypothetical protein
MSGGDGRGEGNYFAERMRVFAYFSANVLKRNVPMIQR